MPIWTIEQYQNLCGMLAKGITKAQINGESVEFRSLDEMVRIKAMMERALGLAPAIGPSYPSYQKG
ncbi:phage head-tail joining protein [Roseicitreum antarcticum]|uniref:Uncharacterized protein n=1 Tax=Roseicitreum antarcticum TaxID=564137 RepID=A0A1H3ETP0_9RHOB|nr:hypothetical protein [Roseicitreum antarcticum]SDX81478.1 hypothetical protein SAMN04488238_12517 [Roseicitreum antarcticum]